ncbi:PqqD family protein [Candidatus Chloroploca sp. Khr17]|nr:PqqD family protein [Candidatus Chloroploca sp. Khr17]
MVDTETGIYFSLTGSGYLIMQMFDQGARIADLVA